MNRFLLIFFILGFFTPCTAQEKGIYNIGFLLDKETAETELLLLELQNEIITVVGEDATVSFAPENKLVNNFNLQEARANYQELIDNETDIIIALGLVNNTVITSQTSYPKPTILFGVINEDLIETGDGLQSSSIPNYTFIVSSISFEEDLRVFQELTNFNRVGILIEKDLLDHSELESRFDKITKSLEVSYKFIPYTTVDDIVSDTLDVDAVYFAGGFYLEDAEIKRISDFLIDQRIPSFTASSVKDVANGIMATNQRVNNIDQFFRRIALAVETVVSGTDLSESPVYNRYDRELTVNYNTAQKVGIPIKYSLVATTNFVGDFKNLTFEKKYSLLDVMREAIAENLGLELSRQDVAITEQEVRVAQSDYLPDLRSSVSGSYIDPALAAASNGSNPEISTNARINLSQTLFSEAANANISIQKALQQAQNENYNSAEFNTVINASFAYFDALILKANLQIANQNLALTKRNLQIAQQNFEAGLAGKTDVLRFRSELAQNMQQLIVSANDLNQAYYALNQLLNNPIDFKIDVEEAELQEGIFRSYNYDRLATFLDDPTLRRPFVEFLVEEAINNAPELKALDYNLKAAERSVKLYGGGRFLPTLALQGQYNYELSRSGTGTEYPPIFTRPPEGFYTVGVNVSLPVFMQNKQNINKQIAQIQKDQIRINSENTRLNIERNINDAVLNLTNQIANIRLSEVSERTAKESLELTQTAYENGAVNIVQLLDAQNNYLEAQVAKINASYTYLLRSLELERYLGYFFLLHTEAENQEFIQRFLAFSQNK